MHTKMTTVLCKILLAQLWSCRNHTDVQSETSMKTYDKKKTNIREPTNVKSLVTRIDGRASRGCHGFCPIMTEMCGEIDTDRGNSARTGLLKIGENLTGLAVAQKRRSPSRRTQISPPKPCLKIDESLT